MDEVKPQKLLKILLNTDSKDGMPWRVLVDGQEKFIKHFFLHVPSFDTVIGRPDATMEYCFSCYYTTIEWRGTAIIVK